MRGQVVRVRAALDDADHLVDGRVDDVVDVAGVVALEDPDRDPLIGVEPRHSLCGDRCGEENDAGEDAHGSIDEWRHG